MFDIVGAPGQNVVATQPKLPGLGVCHMACLAKTISHGEPMSITFSNFGFCASLECVHHEIEREYN
jgi:hypothetical protein